MDLADDGFGNLIYASGLARNMYLYDTWYRAVASARGEFEEYDRKYLSPKHGIKYANP
jgi:hypothetical protein